MPFPNHENKYSETALFNPEDFVKYKMQRGIVMKEETRRLYLKVGDQVIHRRFPQWGYGVVDEERNSQVLGGSSYVKITFSHIC